MQPLRVYSKCHAPQAPACSRILLCATTIPYMLSTDMVYSIVCGTVSSPRELGNPVP